MTVRRLFGPSWSTRLQVCIGLVMFGLWVLNALNAQYGDGAFLYDVWDLTQVPSSEWFTHDLQWGSNGCGSEICR